MTYWNYLLRVTIVIYFFQLHVRVSFLKPLFKLSCTVTLKLHLISPAIIMTKLLYGLSGAWFKAAERRRLDGFQNRCLRSIWGIKPSYISRISNATVLGQTRQPPLTKTLQKHQVLLFGKVAQEPEGSPMREATFYGNTLDGKASRVLRRRGRPRLEWAGEVYKLALQAAGGQRQIQQSIYCPSQWRATVEAFVVHR